MSEPTAIRYDPTYRHARARKDERGTWQIETYYGQLPLNAFITYGYRVDDFLPVVWDTLPSSREEQETVAIEAANAFLSAKVATPGLSAAGDRTRQLRHGIVAARGTIVTAA